MVELATPTVRPDPRLAAEFRPRMLESWLERLPRTDRQSCLQQLYKALSTQNRVELDPVLRLQLMELYLEPFLELQALHHSDLRTISRMPLHPHYRARQEEMLSMLDSMASGYKIAVLDLALGRRGQGSAGGLAQALQRAMHCLAERLVTAYELYSRPPGGAWREVHELYRCAEGEDLVNTEVAPLPGRSEPPTVLGTYVPILLLGAGSPNGLLPGEARRLHELAPQWRRAAKITIPEALPVDPGYFRFDLDADAPPFPVSKSRRPLDETSRVVRTLGVARAMHQVLTDMNDATTQNAVRKVLGPGMEQADAELFRRIGRVFGEVDIKRSSNRFPARQELELHLGFEPVYRACSGGREIRALDTQESSTPATPEPSAETAGEQFIDLSEPMLGVPVDGGGQEASMDPGGSGRFHSRRARCVNQSAGGQCLVLDRSGDIRLKVGDIAASRPHGNRDWQLGVVRWLRIGSKEIRFGMQFLGPVAVPVAVVPAAGRPGYGDTGSGADAVAAIWLPENPVLKQANSIVLPRAAEPWPPNLAVLGEGGAPARIRLLRRTERTGDYEQFLVSLDQSESIPESSFSS
jgi:cyclic-di-GMP-binding protein